MADSPRSQWLSLPSSLPSTGASRPLTYGSALPMPTAARSARPPSPTPWNFHFVTLSTLKFIAIGANKGKRFPASTRARSAEFSEGLAEEMHRKGWHSDTRSAKGARQ